MGGGLRRSPRMYRRASKSTQFQEFGQLWQRSGGAGAKIRRDDVLSRGPSRTSPGLRRRDGDRADGHAPRRRRLRRDALPRLQRGNRAVAPRPDRRRPRVVPRGRSGRAGDGHVYRLASQARRVRARRAGRGRQPPRRRDRARRRRQTFDRRAAALRRRLARADRDADLLIRPDALANHVRRTGRPLRRTGRAPGRGRRRPPRDRDEPRPARDEGRDRRDRASLRPRRAARPDSGAGDPRSQRANAVGHRHQSGLRDARRVADQRRRSQLFDGSGADARRGSLPGRKLALLRERHPQCRPAADGPQGRDDLSGDARRDGARTRRLRARLRRQCDRRLLRHDAGAHPRVRCRRARTQGTRARRADAPVRRVGDDRRVARAGSTAVDRRRAAERAGLAPGQTPAPGGRLRRTDARRARAGRGRRARARTSASR